jgi:hypothetical protein
VDGITWHNSASHFENDLLKDFPYDRYYLKRDDFPWEQLTQLLRIVWDGDLISKSDRDQLVHMGFVDKQDGFNIITKSGIHYLVINNRISFSWFFNRYGSWRNSFKFITKHISFAR